MSLSSPSSSNNNSFFQSKLREIERKISLENAHNEELMLELALQKKQTGGGSSSLTAGGTAGTSATAATTNSTQINNLLNQELQLAGLQGTGIGLPATTSGLFFASFFCWILRGIVLNQAQNSISCFIFKYSLLFTQMAIAEAFWQLVGVPKLSNWLVEF